MYTTNTRLENMKYDSMHRDYVECAQVLGKILQRGLNGCTLEHLDGVVGHDSDMDSFKPQEGYKIIQPGDLPALAITKRAYDMIMGVSA